MITCRGVKTLSGMEIVEFTFACHETDEIQKDYYSQF